MDECKKYLAERLLSEELPVTYRLLSRHLDIHVNTAKQMLYEYKDYQNAQKPDSVHATYLVYGIKNTGKASEGEDTEMDNSMPSSMPSSMPDQDPLSEEVPTTTLTLAREENLKDVLADYKEVISIHVYSLAPHPQRDLSLLTDVTKALSEYAVTGGESKKYGVIANPYVRRRDRQAREAVPKGSAKPVVAQTSSSKSTAAAHKPQPMATKVKQESTGANPSSKNSTPTFSAATKVAPSLKKSMSGGIMQSFAKAAQKPAKPKPEPKKEEDTPMSDDGEADDDDIMSSKKAVKSEEGESIRQTKKQREDALRKMMEEDDDEEDEPEEKDDEEMEEPPEPEPEPQPEIKEEKQPEQVNVENGRRRGKRQVMKKKRVQDEQGYLVTIQEKVWESFSEDEAPPPAKKPAVTSTPAADTKPKKPTGKGGHGNIMSFFSKKS